MNSINIIISESVDRQIALELNARILRFFASLRLSFSHSLSLSLSLSLSDIKYDILDVSHFSTKNLHIEDQIRLRCLLIVLTTSIILFRFTSVALFFFNNQSENMMCWCYCLK